MKNIEDITIFLEITTFDGDEEEIILQNESLVENIELLREVNNWLWFSGRSGFSLFDKDGNEKSFDGPNAIKEMIRQYDAGTLLRNFKTIIR